MPNDSPQPVIVGRVRNVHGLRGELVVEPHTDDPDAIFVEGRKLAVGNVRGVARPEPVEIVAARPFKGGFIVKFAGIDDRNEAELWRERYFFVDQSELTPLEEGEVYIHELRGMTVQLEGGEKVGRVVEVYELPQGLVLDVARADDSTVMIPYEPAVTRVDRAARVICIHPPDGLLD